MWHVYKTAVSDVTSDYAGNTANQFKVKLGLKLPGKGWKVSIGSAILPKMALLKNLQSAGVNVMELWEETEKQGQSNIWQNGYVKALN